MSEPSSNNPDREERLDDHEGAADPGETIIHDAGAVEEEADETLAALIDADAPPAEIAREVESQEPADAADALETLEPDDAKEVLNRMGDEAAADALAHMNESLALSALLDLPPDEAASYLSLMDPDDAVDLLQVAPRERAAEWMARVPAETAAKLGRLAHYDAETAGGLMTTEFIAIRDESTISQAVEELRAFPDEIEQQVLYCVDGDGRLTGELAFRDLVISPAGAVVSDVMRREIDALKPELDQEEVAMIFDRYDEVTMPVIDSNRLLLGVVQIDDVIDIIREEQTEDAFKQVGVGEGESVLAPLPAKIKSRLPWLMGNLFMATIAALVVLKFEGLIEQVAILAVIMPIIANQAGNAGHQSLAVTLRGLVLQEVHRGRTFQLLIRETALGLISGLAIGIVIGLVITVVGSLGAHTEASWRLGFIAAASMSGALALGCLAGAAIPLCLDRMKLDPAAGSSIFVTMVTDTVSFAAFLGLAYLLRSWILPV